MKKLIILILGTALLLLTGCVPSDPRQKTAEQYVMGLCELPSTYKTVSFTEIGRETLRDQIDERISYFTSVAERDSSEVVRALSLYESEKKNPNSQYVEGLKQSHEDAVSNYSKTYTKLRYLNELLETSTKLDEVVATVCLLTFKNTNQLGVTFENNIELRFNDRLEVVAYKMPFSDEWITEGNWLQIPGYYDK